MTRNFVLGTVLAVGAMSIAVGAVQQAPAAGGGQGQKPMVVAVEKLKDNLFVLRGGGGTTAVFVQASGVTVVDTKNPGWGQPILDKIKELTSKPVTTIVNTHTHGDHVSGNVEFPAEVTIVAHANTRANMAKMASPPGFGPPSATPQPTIFEKHQGKGLPGKTFTDRLTLGSGADRVDLYYFGRGHTNGDAMIVFPAHRVMHMGDLFPGKQIPIMDSNNGGSGLEYPETLKKVHAGVKDVESIITGHSTVMTPNDLQEYAAFLSEFVESVRAAKKAGQTAEQVASSWKIPEKYAGYAPPQAPRLRATVETIFKELE
jgi:glyoxylase-like metal-dependent hydrolase (beta-lactamase superfamily II)